MKRFAMKTSAILDKIAGFTFIAVMALITCNTIMRLFGHPIRGAVEFVGFLSSIAIGLSLAHCAVQGGHIAITFLVEKLPKGMQKAIDLIVQGVVFLFLGFIVVRLWVYANTLRTSGQIALTTGVPYYPFVLVIDLGFLVYCLVVLSEIVETLTKGVDK